MSLGGSEMGIFETYKLAEGAVLDAATYGLLKRNFEHLEERAGLLKLREIIVFFLTKNL